jgi:hypothetical protein
VAHNDLSKIDLEYSMSKAYQCFPDGKAYTIQELEIHLKFKYLPSISFETPEDQRNIKKQGIENWKNNRVSAESQELGNRFIQKIKAEYIPDVSIRWLNESLGHGLFLEENLERGSYVGEYTGIVRKNDLRRYFNPINNYLYEYPVPDEIGKSHVIDASQGNLTRFINHSFHPNLDPVYVFYDGFYHLIFLAIHRIEKGTQLCYNYGKNYWYIRSPPINL